MELSAFSTKVTASPINQTSTCPITDQYIQLNGFCVILTEDSHSACFIMNIASSSFYKAFEVIY